MKKLFLTLFTACICYLVNGQVSITQVRNPYVYGDVLIGVNSDVTNTRLLDLALTPTVGYVVDDKHMVYVSGKYIGGDYDYVYLLVGANRAIYKSVFAGVSLYYADYSYTSNWGSTFKLGIHRELWKGVFVAPSLDLNKTFIDTEPFNLSTKVTFGLRI